ncbi:MAG TPA: RHS repeat-associated core domain-containing protein [Terriglobales bacterium]|jgi:RHS repeat-associated protein|nr:RHS repeat-associated core domain-containing protein [Terriglobales bacterium]
MPYQATDARGYTTTYSYDPAFAGAYVTTMQMPTTSNGVQHSVSAWYDFNTGLKTRSTDQNQQTTTYAYDNMARLASVTGPPDPNNGGQSSQTIYTYYDVPTPPVSTVQQNIDGRQTLSWTLFDGFGRATRTATWNDEDPNNPYDQVDTCYDGLGQKYYTSYPYRSTGFNASKACNNSQQPGDTFNYDALGRVTAVTHADNNVVSTDSTQFPTVKTADETGRARENRSDALGRLTMVWEPDAGGNFSYETDYQYDALDNLTQVNQKGDGSQPRLRSFAYDSLSRLLTAVNPESGTINYLYDANSNLIEKDSPAPNQTSSILTIRYDYSYDELNRLLSRSASHQLTDNFTYDLGTVKGIPVHNPIGRLVLSSSATHSIVLGGEKTVDTIHSYDVMGRTEFEVQYPNRSDHTVSQQFNYAYNLDGSLKSIIYPSISYPGPIRIDYGYNRAQRPVSAVDAQDHINYYTGALYTAFGAPSSMIYGVTPNSTGITWTNNYNIRMQPTLLSATSPTQTVLSVGYDFGTCNYNQTNNGNVCKLINGRDATRNQSFTYDNLNRLLSATSSNWSESFGYDPWGNLLQKNVSGSLLPTEFGFNPPLTVNVNNQVTSWCYDAAGNIVGPSGTCPSYTQPTPQAYENVFDGQNRLTSYTVKGTTTTTSYDYDADGQRVSKINPDGSGTLYWYGPGGEALEETDLAGNMTADYIFAGGKRIARLDLPNPCSLTFPVHYYFADHLGSADVITNSDASTIEAETEFYPWGGEHDITDLGIDNHYKFTGKERDPETGLDYFGARYYGSSIGRFITPDWAAKPVTVPYANFGNPQSLNLYSYVKNNPTTFGDPDGHCDVDHEHHGKAWCFFHAIGLAQTQKEEADVTRQALANRGVKIYQNGVQVNLAKVPDSQVIDLGVHYWRAVLASEDGEVNTYTPSAAVAAMAVGHFANGALLESHFADHGTDFGAKTKAEYEQQASKFLNGPRGSGVLEKIRPSNGDIVRYNPATEEFGVARADGTIRTYFKPDPAVHGLPTNLDYFNAQ